MAADSTTNAALLNLIALINSQPTDVTVVVLLDHDGTFPFAWFGLAAATGPSSLL